MPQSGVGTKRWNQSTRLSGNLKEWWKLAGFAAFRAEAIKVFKADIPLADRSAWEDWFNRDKAAIAALGAEIAAAEQQIDNLIYSLFKLNSQEIRLLEATVAS